MYTSLPFCPGWVCLVCIQSTLLLYCLLPEQALSGAALCVCTLVPGLFHTFSEQRNPKYVHHPVGVYISTVLYTLAQFPGRGALCMRVMETSCSSWS